MLGKQIGGFFSPRTFLYTILPEIRTSWAHSPCVRRCRTFPIPAPCAMPFRSPLPSADAATIAYNSASAELNAITFCCLQYVLITCSPIQTDPPLVDFADQPHPAQSKSVNVVIFDGIGWYLNSETSLGWPHEYFPIFIM